MSQEDEIRIEGLPRGRLELEILRALLDDVERDTMLWLRAKPSTQEQVYLHAMQQRLGEIYAIVTHQIEGRGSADEDTERVRIGHELVSLLNQAKEVRGRVVGENWDRLTDRLREARKPGKRKSGDRRAMVNAYISEVFKKTGKMITRKGIWSAAGYKSRTEFERWERQDAQHPNKAADERFTRILREKPHLK